MIITESKHRYVRLAARLVSQLERQVIQKPARVTLKRVSSFCLELVPSQPSGPPECHNIWLQMGPIDCAAVGRERAQI